MNLKRSAADFSLMWERLKHSSHIAFPLMTKLLQTTLKASFVENHFKLKKIENIFTFCHSDFKSCLLLMYLKVGKGYENAYILY